MNQERILVVEDKLKIAELHRDYLEQSGFQVSILAKGDEVVNRIQKEPADLILLDLMLPGKSGEEVFRKLRTFSNIPIIMVTAKTEEIDRLL
ncbi:MAG: response regulator [bacterium]